MRMSGNTIASVIGTLGLVLLVTTAVLPGRITPAVLSSGGTAAYDIEKGALGQ